jgi:2-polyprenyl-3-methyl-5-hydroxy-6-metoxy-1,4-benzoquinol methylase
MEPDPFFLSAYEQFVEPSFPHAGVALDLACGLGRHALWLADRSWQVTAVDLSDERKVRPDSLPWTHPTTNSRPRALTLSSSSTTWTVVCFPE